MILNLTQNKFDYGGTYCYDRTDYLLQKLYELKSDYDKIFV